MFAERLKELRTSLGMSQRDFAEKAGISPTTLVSYEKGGKTPSYSILVKLANEFGISLDWLCEIKQEDKSLKPRTLGDSLRLFASLAQSWEWGKAIQISFDDRQEMQYGKYPVDRRYATLSFTGALGLRDSGSPFDICDYVQESAAFANFADTEYLNGVCFTYTFMQALNELNKMIKLVHDGTIQESLFDLWLNDKCLELNKYDVFGNYGVDSLLNTQLESAENDGGANGDDN